MIDMSPDEFRRLGYRAIDLLADELASLHDRPCRSPVPPDVQHALMHQPLPRGAVRRGRVAGVHRRECLSVPHGQ